MLSLPLVFVLVGQLDVEGHAHALDIAVAGAFEGQKRQGGQPPQNGADRGFAHVEDGGDIAKPDDVGFGFEEQVQHAALVVVELVDDARAGQGAADGFPWRLAYRLAY